MTTWGGIIEFQTKRGAKKKGGSVFSSAPA
jgi:hypothetical protein